MVLFVSRLTLYTHLKPMALWPAGSVASSQVSFSTMEAISSSMAFRHAASAIAAEMSRGSSAVSMHSSSSGGSVVASPSVASYTHERRLYRIGPGSTSRPSSLEGGVAQRITGVAASVCMGSGDAAGTLPAASVLPASIGDEGVGDRGVA
jgi:hypothetical protein